MGGEERGEPGDEQPKRRRKPRKKQQSAVAAPITVEIRSRKIFVALHTGKTLLVKADSCNLDAFVELMLSYGKAEVTANKDKEKEMRAESKNDGSAVGRAITWDFFKHTYIVHFQGDDGKNHITTQGLRVPRKGLNGELLSVEAFNDERCKKKAEAVAMWNLLDKSGQERLPL